MTRLIASEALHPLQPTRPTLAETGTQVSKCNVLFIAYNTIVAGVPSFLAPRPRSLSLLRCSRCCDRVQSISSWLPDPSTPACWWPPRCRWQSWHRMKPKWSHRKTPLLVRSDHCETMTLRSRRSAEVYMIESDGLRSHHVIAFSSFSIQPVPASSQSSRWCITCDSPAPF